MKQLNPNWVTEGLIDFEYKKYIILSYLKHVCENFDSQKLYPFLSDLIHHFKNLTEIKEKKNLTSDNLNGNLTKVDLENFKLEYEKVIEENEFMEEIEMIVDFAIHEISKTLKDGKQIYDFVEDSIEISPVGILPLNRSFGYLLVKNGSRKEVNVFDYEVMLFENSNEQYRAIKTSFKKALYKSTVTTYESLKLDIIRSFKSLPNPATFLINSNHKLPMSETLLPVAKRSFVRFLTNEVGLA